MTRSLTTKPDIPKILMHAWHWLVGHATLECGSLLIAGIALIISVWSAVIARRSAHAAQIQASAAEEQAQSAKAQAEASEQQVWQASNAVLQTRDAAEVAALIEARARIDDAAPKPVVAVKTIPWPPLRAESLFDIPFPHPTDPDNNQWPPQLDFWEHRFEELYFPIHGTLYNDGSEAMRVLLDGPRFLQGSTSLGKAKFDVPIKVHPQYPQFLLHAGQTAFFQFIAAKTADDWLDLADNDEHLSYPYARFIAFPGSSDEPVTTVRLELRCEPVKPESAEESKLIILNPENYAQMQLSIEYIRSYPASFTQIHAELTDDFMVLHMELARQDRQKGRPH